MKPTAPDTAPTRILRKPDVIKRVGLSSTTIWRLTKLAKFPPPVQLGENSVGWREADVEQWLTSRQPRG